MSAFQRWRLATSAAAVQKLKRQKLAGDVGRGVTVAEAVLRRRGAGRVVAGFRRWREADKEVRNAKRRLNPIQLGTRGNHDGKLAEKKQEGFALTDVVLSRRCVVRVLLLVGGSYLKVYAHRGCQPRVLC